MKTITLYRSTPYESLESGQPRWEVYNIEDVLLPGEWEMDAFTVEVDDRFEIGTTNTNQFALFYNDEKSCCEIIDASENGNIAVDVLVGGGVVLRLAPERVA
ncbi:MAG: hypothetical protein RR547_07010 [Raoultibacter sp.]